MKKFASLLGEYIEASGMKQTRIASSAHISYNYLIRLLAGDRHPSEPVVYKLAEALRLSAEQAGELLAAAGYAPSLALIQPSATHEQVTLSEIPSTEINQVTRFVQQFYRLAQEIPGDLQDAFLEEMKHLLGYARYKYILSGGANLLDLDMSFSHSTRNTPSIEQHEQSYFDLIAQMVGELQTEPEEENAHTAETFPQAPPEAVEDILSAIDHLIGSILAGEISTSSYQPQMVIRMFDALREGAPWEIRRRIAEALPSLCRLDVPGTEQLMNVLRLDNDDMYSTDIRRRVVEALPALFEASPLSLPATMRLLHPVAEDDIYVALATIEACGDIQAWMRVLFEDSLNGSSRKKSLESGKMTPLLQKYQAEIPRIQRQLLFTWEGTERECIQFSLALHDLLHAPDTMLHSLQDGLQSPNKLIQIVATRYLEHLLPTRPRETLELYKTLLHETTWRNVRRTVAKALPNLLHCLKEASLSIRTLARTVISTLATDQDIYIRRAVADYATQMFYIDREFLLILLRQMHKDRDPAIRNRLQPVVLRLAQIWLTSYAETAGLIDVKHAKRTRTEAAIPFGE